MSRLPQRAWNWFRRVPFVSPGGFLVLAAVPPLLFGILHLMGARPAMGILCMTVPPGWGTMEAALAAGAYLVAWLLVAAMSPALLIASGVFLLLQRRFPCAAKE